MMEASRQKIAAVLAKAEELKNAFADEQWQQVEVLLQQRNQLAEQAFTAGLPPELHEYAGQVFEQLRAQDDELTEKAKLLQGNFREELMQLNKSKKSIEAYKGN
jgi:molybdopterin-biosynthesis enzyme MoeA-like protein